MWSFDLCPKYYSTVLHVMCEYESLNQIGISPLTLGWIVSIVLSIEIVIETISFHICSTRY